MKARIIVTDEIVSDALSGNKPITAVLAEKYVEEIADRVKGDERLRDMDAFQMALMDAGIHKHSKVQDFYTTEKGNEWLFPAFVDRRLHEAVPEMNLLPYLVASTESCPTLSVRSAKLEMDEDNKDATRMKRVNEGTDLPLAVIKLAESAITLFKRGRAVEASYETLMYMSVNMFAKHLDMIAGDVSGQQVGDAITTLIKGDGNSNPAPVTPLDGELTVDKLAAFAIDFWREAKVPIDTIVCGDGELYKKLFTTTYSKDVVNGAMAGMAFNFPQAMLKNLDVVYDPRVTEGAAKEQLIALNRGQALVKHVAAGSQIRELAANIRNQTKLGTISEIAGFEKFNSKASRILRVK